MNLTEWLALSAEDRNAIRLKWTEHDTITGGDAPWLGLLDEATNRFSLEFAHHPLINRVEHSHSGHIVEILVTTNLYPPQYIEDIPGHYCGFLVSQDAINGRRDYYLQYWTILFRELVGWTKEQTLMWASQWDDDMNGREFSMFYHDDEFELSLHHILRLSGVNDRNVATEIQPQMRTAILHKASHPIWLSPCDWEAMRARVNEILSRVGARLPYPLET